MRTAQARRVNVCARGSDVRWP